MVFEVLLDSGDDGDTAIERSVEDVGAFGGAQADTVARFDLDTLDANGGGGGAVGPGVPSAPLLRSAMPPRFVRRGGESADHAVELHEVLGRQRFGAFQDVA